MALTPADIRHIAKLSRINLSEKEVAKFTKELSSILECVDKLKEVDTRKCKPTKQITGLKQIFRKDEVKRGLADVEKLLETSPLKFTENQIETQAAHG